MGVMGGQAHCKNKKAMIKVVKMLNQKVFENGVNGGSSQPLQTVLFEIMNNTLQVLLNRAVPFEGQKIRLLDQVTQALSSPNVQEVNEATGIWRMLSDDPSFWLCSDQILVHSTNNHTKFLTLVVMENGIKSRWLALPAEQRQGIKVYIVNMVLTLGGNPNLPKDVESLLSKANSILVQIVKYQWNTTWKSFIPDICGASKSNLTLCQNNLNILKMLIEEIFEFSKNQMTAQQINSLKEHMHQEFTQVFELCDSILQSADKVSAALSKACLQTLYSFLSWIPIFYIFFSGTIERIIPFISSDMHREPALRCLVEIVSLNVAPGTEREEEIKQKMFVLLKQSMEKFNQLIPINQNIDTIRAFKQRNQSFAFEITCQNIARFLVSILQVQYEWLVETGSANPIVQTEVRKALKWLVRLMQLPYDQTYKMIVEFFHFLSKKIKERSATGPKPLLYSRETLTEMVSDIFEQVKRTIILRMMKPQQVLIVIDQSGYPVREQISNTENNALYEMMRELLINLAEFNWSTTKTFILGKIEKQNQEEFSFDILNSLSWAVGSMNGYIPQHEEKPFLIAVIRTLLHLCQAKKGKQNKAVVASCIMYVVGQYPNFLKSNWNFLKTVVKKLFEFMKQKFPGVMDMACNTFLKIAKNTNEQFVKLQQNEGQPFVNDLIRRIPQEIHDLTADSLKFTFYEAVGYIIASERNLETKTVLMKSTLGQHLEEYNNILRSAEINPEIMNQEEVQRKMMYFLKINERLAYSIGLSYGSLLITLSPSLNNIYTFYANEVEKTVTVQGKNVLNYLTVKRMRAIGKQILKVYNTYISKCENLNKQEVDSVIESFVIPLVELLVNTYAKALPEVKDAEFLNLLTSIFQRLNVGISHDMVVRVLTTVFATTLSMISSDFNSFPEIRMAFFSFLKSIIKYNFEQLYNMPEDKFHTIMDCIVWSIKHELNTFSDLGLELLYETLQNLTNNVGIANIFYERYYTSLLKDILEVLTDGYHKSGFKMQCKILFLMFQVVTSNYVSSKIGGPTQLESNQEFLFNYLVNVLSSAFTNVSKNDTMVKVKNMLGMGDQKLFKAEVGDYLVMINRYTSVEQQEIQMSAN